MLTQQAHKRLFYWCLRENSLVFNQYSHPEISIRVLLFCVCVCVSALGLQGSCLLRKQDSAVYFCPKTQHAETVGVTRSDFHVVKCCWIKMTCKWLCAFKPNTLFHSHRHLREGRFKGWWMLLWGHVKPQLLMRETKQLLHLWFHMRHF